MWISIEAIQAAMARSAGTRTSGVDPSIYEQAHRQREAEKEILEKGLAICMYCEEEIKYNPDTALVGWPWESETMLGWCDNVKGNRHSPRIETEEDL